MSERTSAATKPTEPSLRQRAARLRDAAGRFIRREGDVSTPPSQPVPSADPDVGVVATTPTAFDARCQTSAEAAKAVALVAAIEREWPLLAAADFSADDTPQAEAEHEAAYARRNALLDAAEALPASCREARHAKALALAWVEFSHLWRAGQTRERYGTDGRLALDIHASLIDGSASAAKASNEYDASAEWPLPVDELDLASQPIPALRALHSAAEILMEVAFGLTGQRNVTSRLANWLVNYLCRITSLVEEEAWRRGRVEQHEDLRLSIVARAILLNEDPAEMRAFSDAILAEVRAHG